MELKRIYQRIIDANHGDCYKCSICTLLGVDYEKAPNFVEHENWHQLAQEFLMKHGYKFTYEVLYNPLLSYLENPTYECFKAYERDPKYGFYQLQPEWGINGLFLASVYSPKYTNPNEHPANHTHSVLCDANYRIIHDPQPEYQGILQYPYAKLIGFNGIRTIEVIRKISEDDGKENI